MGKKNDRFCNLRKRKDLNKKQLTQNVCYVSPVWSTGRFMGFM